MANPMVFKAILCDIFTHQIDHNGSKPETLAPTNDLVHYYIALTKLGSLACDDDKRT